MKTLIITKVEFIASYLSRMYSIYEADVMSDVVGVDLSDYDRVIAPEGELSHHNVSNLLTYSLPSRELTLDEMIGLEPRLKNQSGEAVAPNIQLNQESHSVKECLRTRSALYQTPVLTNDQPLKKRRLIVTS